MALAKSPRGAKPVWVKCRAACDYICRLHDEGLSVRAIVARLNAEKVPAQRGGKWWIGTVQTVLFKRAICEVKDEATVVQV